MFSAILSFSTKNGCMCWTFPFYLLLNYRNYSACFVAIEDDTLSEMQRISFSNCLIYYETNPGKVSRCPWITSISVDYLDYLPLLKAMVKFADFYHINANAIHLCFTNGLSTNWNISYFFYKTHLR